MAKNQIQIDGVVYTRKELEARLNTDTVDTLREGWGFASRYYSYPKGRRKADLVRNIADQLMANPDLEVTPPIEEMTKEELIERFTKAVIDYPDGGCYSGRVDFLRNVGITAPPPRMNLTVYAYGINGSSVGATSEGNVPDASDLLDRINEALNSSGLSIAFTEIECHQA